MAITDNYKRILPVTSMGTPELAYFVVDMEEDIETNYDDSNSLYSQAVQALQLKTDLYMVSVPDGNIFTFAARASSVPGAVAGATSGTIPSLGTDITEFVSEETVTNISILNGGSANDVGDEFEFRHVNFATPLRVRVTSDNAGVATGVSIVNGGIWKDSANLPANTNAAGFTRVQVAAGMDSNGTNLQININAWGLNNVTVYNASIVGGELLWNND
jgi:hypothetical protein